MVSIARDNLQRLFMYIDKLPLLVSESVFAVYDAHIKWQLSSNLHYSYPILENTESHDLRQLSSATLASLRFPCVEHINSWASGH